MTNADVMDPRQASPPGPARDSPAPDDGADAPAADELEARRLLREMVLRALL